MRVVIGGGGNVGMYIASELAEQGHEILVIEIDERRVERLHQLGIPDRVEVLTGDACEVADLRRAVPGEADVFVAVTGFDEENLVVSLLAKQEFAVPRVLARVNHPENEWLFTESWGVDVAVSTPHLLTALVEEAVSVGSLVRLLSLEGGQARLSSLTLASDSPAVGAQIVDLGFPRDSTVVAVVRDSHVVVPRGDTELYEGDEVLVLVTPESEDAVTAVLATAGADADADAGANAND
jgi:trk system potassium uptake protein TrkA